MIMTIMTETMMMIIVKNIIIIMLTSGRNVKVEIVLQVPVSPILVTCSVTCGLYNDDHEDNDD